MHNTFTISQMLPTLIKHLKRISTIFSNVWVILTHKNCQYCALKKGEREKRNVSVFKLVLKIKSIIIKIT